MTLLEQTSGTLVNTVTVVAGSLLGLLLRGRLAERTVTTVMQAIGLVTVFIGVNNAFDLTKVSSPPGLITGLVALALGGVLGEWWQLGERLEKLGERLKARFGGQGSFTEGFMAASLLFCVGPLTLVGSIQNGLAGDDSFLLLKAALDGVSSIGLAATFGFGVLFAAATVIVIQGSISLSAGLLAGFLSDPGTDPNVLLVNGVGGLLILGLGLTLLGAVRIRTASLLPALLLVVIIHQATGFFGSFLPAGLLSSP